ncbi:MAG: 4Fe-4S dicluster domain-containing protein [Desulfobacterales bacterium]|nr:4Fe-4S dicluster domain-containing protein [Desulfobacterales bacterium]
MKYGMAIDLKRCIGCHACTIACKAENGIRPGIFWNRVFDEEYGKYPMVRRRFFPRPCMHCDEAPCVAVCPSGASYKRADGIVMVDPGKCLGCGYCVVACPYGARSYNRKDGHYFPHGPTPYEKVSYAKHEVGTVEKCTFCAHKVDKGEEPACVTTCPPRARIFGNLEDPDSEVSRVIRARQGRPLWPEMDTRPCVYYLSL